MSEDWEHESEFVGGDTPPPGLSGRHSAPREHGALRLTQRGPPKVNRAPQADQGSAGKYSLQDAAAAGSALQCFDEGGSSLLVAVRLSKAMAVVDKAQARQIDESSKLFAHRRRRSWGEPQQRSQFIDPPKLGRPARARTVPRPSLAPGRVEHRAEPRVHPRCARHWDRRHGIRHRHRQGTTVEIDRGNRLPTVRDVPARIDGEPEVMGGARKHRHRYARSRFPRSTVIEADSACCPSTIAPRASHGHHRRDPRAGVVGQVGRHQKRQRRRCAPSTGMA